MTLVNGISREPVPPASTTPFMGLADDNELLQRFGRLEGDVFCSDAVQFNLGIEILLETFQQAVNQMLRRRGAGGNEDGFNSVEPDRVDAALIVDQIGRLVEETRCIPPGVGNWRNFCCQ